MGYRGKSSVYWLQSVPQQTDPLEVEEDRFEAVALLVDAAGRGFDLGPRVRARGNEPPEGRQGIVVARAGGARRSGSW